METDIQKEIVDSMLATDGEIRVLIATIASGLGVDVSNVHSTVLCGCPSDLDDYIHFLKALNFQALSDILVT